MPDEQFHGRAACWWCTERDDVIDRVHDLEEVCATLKETLAKVNTRLAVMKSHMALFAAAGGIVGSAVGKYLLGGG